VISEQASAVPATDDPKKYLLFSVILLLLLAAFGIYLLTTEEGKIPVFFFFALSTLAFAATLRLPPKLRASQPVVMITIAQIGIFLLWIFYSLASTYERRWLKEPSAFLSLLAFILAFALVCWTFYYTSRLLQPPQGPATTRFSQLLDTPMFFLCLFLTIFLQVTYMLTFSIAFFELSSSHAGMYSPAGIYITPEKEPVQSERISHSDAGEDEDLYLLFAESSSVPDFDRRKLAHSRCQPIEDLGPEDTSDVGGRNILTLLQTTNLLSRQNEYQQFRVRIEGYATDLVVASKAFQSNYELAEARVRRVQDIIGTELSQRLSKCETREDHLTALRWPSIEWVLLAASNEDPAGQIRIGDRDFAKVSIAIEDLPHNDSTRHYEGITTLLEATNNEPLELLDYIYFMIYTITTTGYGDIIPRAWPTRAIATAANIYEVFFLVIFFQVAFAFVNRRPTDLDALSNAVTERMYQKAAEHDHRRES